MNNTITDVPGLRVGHATDAVGLTGCTVVLCEDGAVGGVDQRGGAPGTRETDLLRPMHLVESVHGVMLAGGSAFGLAAADGVMRYLSERKVGFDAGVARVPIVPAAILFDLAIGRADAWPGPDMGYAACLAASEGPAAEGCVGAGAGCSVGKILGPQSATKAGIGAASMDLGEGLIVAALMVVNAFGDVIDNTGRILAGARRVAPTGERSDAPFADSLAVLRSPTVRRMLAPAGATVIGVVATNARLDRDGCNKVAQMAQDGVARAVRPAHTMYDGDTIFALATGKVAQAAGQAATSATLIGAFAAEVVAEAVRRGVTMAQPAGGLPASRELRP